MAEILLSRECRGLPQAGFCGIQPGQAHFSLKAESGDGAIEHHGVVGSNIFNILAVLGFSAALSPRAIAVPESASQFDIPVMVATAFACLPIFFTGYRIDRWEGGLFLGYYVAYVVYLILDATRAEALKIYSSSMLIFVIPLTALTLLILTLRACESAGKRLDLGRAFPVQCIAVAPRRTIN